MPPADSRDDAPAEERLPTLVKAGYALGDHAINVQLAALSLFYLFFLTEVAGLRPSLAGLVLLIGRAVDAFTDPAMGRISDRTRWRAGRRRPWFLIGALPFGVTFGLLWIALPLESDAMRFAAYAGLYVANTLCSTVLAVPYAALLPEMALGYHERTSTNTWRSIGVVLGVLAAATGIPHVVDSFGGGAEGWARAGLVLGVWVALPWLVVYRVSFERPGFARADVLGLRDGVAHLLRHTAYRRLCALFVLARISVDVAGAMLIFWFTYWLGRAGDFPLGMGLMLGAVAISLPVWLRLARRTDKRTLFVVGAAWWIATLLVLLTFSPQTPRAAVLVAMALAGAGYGVCDMIPWSMLGDAIDEDELLHGVRREGLYAGSFTFLRKLGGALGVAAAGALLEGAGFVRGAPAQGEAALTAIRLLTTLFPAAFLVLAIAVARAYPITRERHAEILRALVRRRSPDGGSAC